MASLAELVSPETSEPDAADEEPEAQEAAATLRLLRDICDTAAELGPVADDEEKPS